MTALARACYALLVRAFPPAQRDRIGRALVDTLVDDVRAASTIRRPFVFVANAVDLLHSGLAARRGGPVPAAGARPSIGWAFIGFDVTLALRGMRKAPGFATAAILSIALGIGLNTTIFSIFNALLLRPVPGAHPQELVTVFTSGDNESLSSSSYPDFEDLAQHTPALSGLMAHTLMFAGVDHDEQSTLVVGELVTENYFDVLGVRLAAGGGFPAGSDRIGGPLSVVIGDTLWRRTFGASPDVIGRTMTIHGHPYTIVGVAPAGFRGFAAGVSAEMWLPVGAVNDVEPVGITDTTPSATGTNRNERRGQRYLFMTGRLKPGATLAEAQREMANTMASLAAAYPLSNTNRTAIVRAANTVRIHPDLDGALSSGATALLIAVGLVLLVACSNIAGLLLARAAGRTREMAVRVAIGAGRAQIVRQLIVESVVLSTIGGAVGLAGALWVTRALGRLQPPMAVSLTLDFSPDPRVFAFTFLLVLVTGLAFGLVPALRASRPDLVPALKGDLTSRAGRRRVTLRGALVAGQVALSTVLLVAAALLLRSFVAAMHTDVRFDAAHVAYAAVNTSKQFPNAAASAAFLARAQQTLAALPGVTSASIADRLPFALTNNTAVVLVASRRGPLKDGGWSVDTADVGSHYFETMGIPIVSGRPIDDRDRGAQSQRVVVINEAAAHQYWPGADALGQTLRVRDGGAYTVVGVSRNHPVRAIGETPRPLVQFAFDQLSPGFANLIVRTSGSPAAGAAAMRRALLSIEPTLSFMALEPLQGMIDTTLFPARAAMVLIGAFGVLALALAAIGLYGVIAYTVASRAREIGIQMALGADRGRILRGVLGRSLSLVAAGAGLGLVLAGLVSQVLSGVLVGVSALDPMTYAGVIAVLAVTGIGASLVPALRAAAIEPKINMTGA